MPHLRVWRDTWSLESARNKYKSKSKSKTSLITLEYFYCLDERIRYDIDSMID
jgi:hypothetical protein